MEAFNDVWFIGDTFVTNTYHTLQAIQTKNRLDKRKDLFLHEQFNLKCFTARPLSLVQSVPTHIVNALIKALDEVNKMPHMIIIIPHDDLAKFLANGLLHEETKTVFLEVLRWMVTAMTRALQSKKDMLFTRKPGVIIDHKPKFVWVKMLSSRSTEMQFLAKVFNSALNEVLAEKKHHHLLDIEKELDLSDHKDAFQKLSAEAITKYWRKLDRIIRRFEFNEISLKPFVPE